MTLVSIVDSVDNTDKLIYIFIFIFIVFVSSKLQLHTNTLIGMIIGSLIIFYIYDSSISSTSNFNVETEYKLKNLLFDEKLPPPDYFYIDVDIINLFDDIKYAFQAYNRDSYVEAVKAVDNVLYLSYTSEMDNNIAPSIFGEELNSFENKMIRKKKTTMDFGLNNLTELFELAEENVTLALNYIHSFIVNIPSDKNFNFKHKDVLKRSHILLKRHLDKIKLQIDKQQNRIGINVNTKFITDYDDTKPFKSGLNSSSDLHTFDIFI